MHSSGLACNSMSLCLACEHTRVPLVASRAGPISQSLEGNNKQYSVRVKCHKACICRACKLLACRRGTHVSESKGTLVPKVIWYACQSCDKETLCLGLLQYYRQDEGAWLRCRHRCNTESASCHLQKSAAARQLGCTLCSSCHCSAHLLGTNLSQPFLKTRYICAGMHMPHLHRAACCFLGLASFGRQLHCINSGVSFAQPSGSRGSCGTYGFSAEVDAPRATRSAACDRAAPRSA